MFKTTSIKLDRHLVARITKYADVAGYASVEEFVTHALEKELAKLDEGGGSEEEIKKRLQGLGYLA